MEYAIPKLIDYSAGKKERFWAEDAACVDCWKIIWKAATGRGGERGGVSRSRSLR